MKKFLIVALAAGGIAALAASFAASSANAAPISQGNAIAATESGLILVRDGCGRGMRMSHRRRACVPDVRRGPAIVVPRIVVVPRGHRGGGHSGHRR